MMSSRRPADRYNPNNSESTHVEIVCLYRLTGTHPRRSVSPYTISVVEQVKLCLVRGFQRLKGDTSLTMTALFGNFFISLIVGSVFYNLPADTSSFYSRGVLLFYAVLLAAFSSALEVYYFYAYRSIASP